MKTLLDWFFEWPERVSRHIAWLAPLFARFIVGWEFLWSGCGKLQNLPAIVENLVGWHIPAAQILAPFVSGASPLAAAMLKSRWVGPSSTSKFSWMIV
jgi:putative oxidoreductase